MTDHEQGDLHDLLDDAVADVEPGYALDRIRARTTTTKRRWPYAAGGAVLAIAASFTAFAVLGPDTAPRATDPGSTTSPSASERVSEAPTTPLAVYFVGDTPDGPRLYLEFRQFTSVPGATDVQVALKTAVVTALTGPPLDPDYRTRWPDIGSGLRNVEVVDGSIRIDLYPSATQAHGLPAAERHAAIEQLIQTAQGAVQQRLPVQFLVNGNPSAEILGLPASEPLANGPVLDTLALVSLTTPSEGMQVDNDEPLVVQGAGNSFEGNIVTRIQRWEGTYIVDQLPAIAGWGEDRLFPFEVTFDLTDVPPGDYVVISQTDDPSGEGRFHTDTRRITVVD